MSIGLRRTRSSVLFLIGFLLLPQGISEIAQLPEWSSLELLPVGLRDYSPNLHELQETRENGDQLNGVHMLVREATAASNLL